MAILSSSGSVIDSDEFLATATLRVLESADPVPIDHEARLALTLASTTYTASSLTPAADPDPIIALISVSLFLSSTAPISTSPTLILILTSVPVTVFKFPLASSCNAV